VQGVSGPGQAGVVGGPWWSRYTFLFVGPRVVTLSAGRCGSLFMFLG
jgi:hypothetical protein